MGYKRKIEVREGKGDKVVTAIKSWPALLESIIERLAGTRGSRYKATITLIDAAIKAFLVSFLPKIQVSKQYTSTSRTAQDPRVKTLRSWASIARELLPLIQTTVPSSHLKTVLSLDKDLKKLRSDVCRVSGIDIGLSPSPAPAKLVSIFSNPADDIYNKGDVSPTIMMLGRKKGLFRDPRIFEPEDEYDKKVRYRAASALNRGPLFSKDTNRRVSKHSHRTYTTIDMPQYPSKKPSWDSLQVTGGTALSFGQEIDTVKKRLEFIDPNTQLLLLQHQENYERPLSVYGQPLQISIPLSRLVESSTLIRNLLVDKHSGVFADECDMVIYDPKKTASTKEFVHQVAIYAQELLFNEEVRKRSKNEYWKKLEEEQFWWGLEVFGRWVHTTNVILEGEGGVKAGGMAAVLTARFLGLDQDVAYWKGLESAMGARIFD